MTEAKRILIIVTQSSWGGVQSYVVRFAKQAKIRGFDVLIAAGGAGELKDQCEREGIEFRSIEHMTRSLHPVKDAVAILDIAMLIRSWKPTSVYLHSSKAGMIGSIAASISGVSHVIYRIAGWSFLDPVSNLQKAIRRWSEKLTAGFKRTIIVLHPGDKQCAEQYHIKPKEYVVMIPNGLDLMSFDRNLLTREEARVKLMDLSGDACEMRNAKCEIVLTIANFYATKDLVQYMEAVKHVHHARPNAHFVIIGDGELRPEIEAKRRACELEEIVSLPGEQNNAPRLLAGADLFVLPSAKEGMSWALLEAMAARLPCIATDVGANKWVLGDAGWIVPAKEPTALAQAIIDALNTPDNRSRGDAARTQIESRFTEGPMWEETFKLF